MSNENPFPTNNPALIEKMAEIIGEEFKMVDDIEEPDEDSYETDNKDIERFQKQYNLNFELDACAKDYNSKCDHYLTDALHQEWIIGKTYLVDVWCNPPHTLNEEFIKRADVQHKKHNINICMIVPANCQSMQTWHNLIESETETITENHPLLKRPKFFKRGRKTKHSSRNAYRIIIWRKNDGRQARGQKQRIQDEGYAGPHEILSKMQ